MKTIVKCLKDIQQGNRIMKKRKEKADTSEPEKVKTDKIRMEIRKLLERIPDKRIDRCKKHNLADILLLCIIGMVCGQTDVESIVFWAELEESWLKKYLKLPHGIPSADTILRVLRQIDSKRFAECLTSWVGGYFQQHRDGSIIAIDGKTVRKSDDGERKAIHLVSAWADELRLVLGQVQTEEKSNEITAIPELLRALDVSGCIITIDAMGCQKEIAAQIVEGKGEYVLALKGNHPQVYAEAVSLFEHHTLPPDAFSVTTDLSKDHGRIEKREAYLCTDLSWFADREKWSDLGGIGCIKSQRTVGQNTSTETRYYLTSLTDVDTFARSVRTHWGIENKLHWTLDVAYREDFAHVRKDHAPANMAVIRKIALNLLRLEPTEKLHNKKLSIARKQLYASRNQDFLLNILAFL